MAAMLQGGCHCGAVRFSVTEPPVFATVCHCRDCQKQSGAPFLAWAMVSKGAMTVQGTTAVYNSSATGRRSFCARCGSGLFFINGPLAEMEMIQVRIAALDDPGAVKPMLQVQAAERIGWVAELHCVPAVERFPTRSGG